MALVLQRTRNAIREQGVGAFAVRVGRRVVTAAQACLALRKHPTFSSPDALLDYADNAFGQLIRPLQVRSEIRALLEVVERKKPKTVLEIGTANGGTLFLWSRVAAPDAHLVSVDLPNGIHGGGYADWRIPIYHRFAMPRQKIDLIRGNSHSPAIIEKTKHLLNGHSADFLFIDAGHRYSDVKQDFENFSPLVSEGGIIALHDVAHHPDESLCEIDRYWRELKDKHESAQFIERSDQGWGGIGYVRWASPLDVASSD